MSVEEIGCCGNHEVHFDKDCGVCKRDAEIAALKAKYEAEHENFLAVHRENMGLASRNMELQSQLLRMREAITKTIKDHHPLSSCSKCRKILAEALISSPPPKLAELLEMVENALRETRNAMAALCREAVKHDVLMDNLPHEFDGFGKRADEALAAIHEFRK